MPKHLAITNGKWDQLFSGKKFVLQEGVELSRLTELGIHGKRVAQFCCNNGVELMSLKNLGASACVGFDISDKAIVAAKERASKFNIDCQFVQANIYDIPNRYFSAFDLVYITIGTLCWMPDLSRFFDVVRKTLKLGGKVFIYERHPFAQLFSTDVKNQGAFRMAGGYFPARPHIGSSGIDYIGMTTYKSSTTYTFSHTLSDIITGIIDSQLSLSHFKEYPHNIPSVCSDIGKQELNIPLSYIIIGEKSRRRV